MEATAYMESLPQPAQCREYRAREKMNVVATQSPDSFCTRFSIESLEGSTRYRYMLDKVILIIIRDVNYHHRHDLC